MFIMVSILRRLGESHTIMVNRWEPTGTLKEVIDSLHIVEGEVRTLFTRFITAIAEITPVSTTLADTGVAFVPMLVAAGVVLVIIGVAVVLVRMRLARVDR
jgi:hypothetical protein